MFFVEFLPPTNITHVETQHQSRQVSGDQITPIGWVIQGILPSFIGIIFSSMKSGSPPKKTMSVFHGEINIMVRGLNVLHPFTGPTTVAAAVVTTS